VGLLSDAPAGCDTACEPARVQYGGHALCICVRYLAELAKFRLAPPALLLGCLRALLDDFAHHSVDAAAALVESAGPFLVRLPESRTRMEALLEVRMHVLGSAADTGAAIDCL
jgi:hypothetical protein